MTHKEIYQSLSRPPESAMKKITGGRLNGMTDIRPQWRYRAMTEQFGLCGIGWKFDIERTWTEQVGDEIMAFVVLKLYVKVDNEWSDGIPGIGGSMLAAQERNGIHASDEAYKMATTDALSVAMKMIGVGAAVYEGEDLSKHSRTVQEKAPESPVSSDFEELNALKDIMILKLNEAAKNGLYDEFEFDKAVNSVAKTKDLDRAKKMAEVLRQRLKERADAKNYPGNLEVDPND